MEEDGVGTEELRPSSVDQPPGKGEMPERVSSLLVGTRGGEMGDVDSGRPETPVRGQGSGVREKR